MMDAKNGAKVNFYQTTDFDNAISLTGYGRFHVEIVLVCALSIITVGFQNGLSSYVFPAAQCDLKLTSFQLGLLNVTFLVGGIVSSFLWGVMADICGRRKVILLSHLLNAALTIFLTFLPSIASLVACRFLNGFLIGAPGSIIFSYLAEFQPPKYRATTVCYCGLFFTFSWLLLPVLAYLVLPLPSLTLPFVTLTPWRIFMLVLALPELLVGLWLLRLPESPRFFIAKGDVQSALVILRRMYATNTRRPPDRYPVKNIICEDNKTEPKNLNTVSDGNKTVQTLRRIFNQIKSLFRAPLLSVSLLTCSIMFANMFGVFGLGLWLPELFIRFQQFQTLHPNSTVTVKQLSQLAQVKNQSCEPSFDVSVIQSTVAMAVSSLIFNAFAGWVASKVKLKTIPLFTMLAGGLSAGCIYWLTSSVQNLVIACVFQATMVTANITIGNIGVELFPTKVGGIAICLIMCSGRIGAICSNMVFGYLMDKHCEVPIFVVAVVVVLGGVLCFFVPEKQDAKAKSSYRKDIEISVISQ